MFRLLSSSNYLSYRSIVFEANVESSNVSVDIRQEYGIFFLQANNRSPQTTLGQRHFIKTV